MTTKQKICLVVKSNITKLGTAVRIIETLMVIVYNRQNSEI